MSDNNDKAFKLAVVGLSGRFPQCPDIETFWQNIIDSKSLLSKVGQHATSANYVPYRGVLNDIDQFDPKFFDISAYEASITDPQQRQFIELCYEALESAGYLGRTDMSVGVFCGMAESQYLKNNLLKNKQFLRHYSKYHTHMMTSPSFLATKISYLLNLTGPSITLDTACSTSLSAIIQACQSLLIYESDIALAGGINIHLPQDEGYYFEEGGVLSPDGTCNAFSADAKGTALGNAGGVIVLKRLQDALDHHDQIHAIITGFAMNNDGSRKTGYAAPSIIGQAECIEKAIQLSGINPETISLVEAHGTGTILGDPIEISGLTRAYEKYTSKKQFCAIGSVKTNVGHTNVAAGVIGFIKTILALKNKVLPPSLNYSKPNPNIDFNNSPFYVNTQHQRWEATEYPRRAAISSFGIGGTNTHVIVEQAPPMPPARIENDADKLIILSAKNELDLAAIKKQLINFIHSNSFENDLLNLAYTLSARRKHYSYRLAFTVNDFSNLNKTLTSNTLQHYNVSTSAQKILFIFPKDNTLSPGSAAYFYQHHQLIRDQIDRAINYIQEPSLQKLVLDHLLKDDTQETSEPNLLTVHQLAFFIFNYSLAHFYLSLNVQPSALIGDGLGEYVAACLAKIFTLSDAIQLIQNTVTISSLSLAPPTIPIASSFLGDWDLNYKINSGELISYLMTMVRDHDIDIFLDIGLNNEPSNIATQIIAQNLDKNRYITATQSNSNPYCYFLTSLGKLWQRGLNIQWDEFYKDQAINTISIPTYPFNRQSCWVTPDIVDNNKINHLQPTNTAVITYQPTWTLCSRSSDDTTHAKIIYFESQCSRSIELYQNLAVHCTTIIRIRTSEAFKDHGNNTIEMNPFNQQHYQKLHATLNSLSALPAQIIYGWSLLSDYRFSILPPVYFFQELSRTIGLDQLSFVALSTNTYALQSSDLIEPEKNFLPPLMLCLAQEMGFQATFVDFDKATDTHAIASECLQTNIEDYLIAYRHGMRFVQHYSAVTNHNHPPLLTPNGVYIIFGGSSELGQLLAEFLVLNYSATVILTTHTQSKISLPKLNSSAYQLAQVDITDKNTVHDFLQAILKQHQKISGLFHLSAPPRHSRRIAAAELTESNIIDQINIKRRGAINLQQAIETLESKPKFCVLYSSLATVLGGVKMAAYAASNAFLDSFACAHNSKETQWISLSWDGWNSQQLSLEESKNQSSLLDTQQALAALAEILQKQAAPHYLIAKSNFEQRYANFVAKKRKQQDTQKIPATNDAEMKPLIRDAFMECLGVKTITDEDDFFQLGGDSLLALRLQDLLETTLGVTVALEDIIHNCTINGLCFTLNQTTTHTLESIIAIKKANNNKKNIFFIHPISGSALPFLELAAYLPTTMNGYAIQDPALNGQPEIFSSLEQMAAAYISRIKSVQPHGPYLLAGYSFGGNLAFEMACQLSKSGETVQKTILFDSWCQFSDLLRDFSSFKRSLLTTQQDFHEKLLALGLDRDIMFEQLWGKMLLLINHKQKFLSEEVILFKAQQLLPEYIAIDDSTNHWQNYCENKVEVYTLSCNHQNILEKDIVESYGSTLLNILCRTEELNNEK